MKNININSIEYSPKVIGEIPGYCEPIKKYFVTTRKSRPDIIFYIEGFSASYTGELNIINLILRRIDNIDKIIVNKYDIVYCFDNINDCKKAILLG